MTVLLFPCPLGGEQSGQPVKQTKFETDKAKLRQAIRNAMDKDQIMAFLSTMKDGKPTKNEDTTEVSADE